MDMMYLIRKTGEGKSLVLQGMASMLKGVTVVMVPLLGLGADQEEKCNGANASSVESYHLDEYRQSNASELRGHLDDYSREEKTAIILFVGPQQLSQHSFWCPVLMSLALRGCISAVCIDEVHSTVQNYESFRPEFKTAIESINKLVGASRRNCPDTYYVPILVMSATFTIKDQHIFNSLIGRLPTMAICHSIVCHLAMECLAEIHYNDGPMHCSICYPRMQQIVAFVRQSFHHVTCSHCKR
jgi:superfamily II DNA helicase RecQ